jgi:hypothetical protein
MVRVHGEERGGAMKRKKPSDASGFSGLWRIIEMDQYENDYLDMEVQAHIRMDRRGSGCFQFGMVCGGIVGRVEEHPGGKRLEFTWDGNDECDHVFGRGWLRAREKDLLEGEIIFHGGDSSTFLARRAGKGKSARRMMPCLR